MIGGGGKIRTFLVVLIIAIAGYYMIPRTPLGRALP